MLPRLSHLCVVLLVLSAIGIFVWPRLQPEPEDFVPRQLVRIAGVTRPAFVRPENARHVSPQTEVIGVCANGLCRAYPIALMSKVEFHIINDVIGGLPVSVTYCDIADCARVLSSQSREDPIPLNVAGMDENGQMLFHYGSQRYRQQSEKLPLADYPFVRTTWAKWLLEHPETLVLTASPR